MIRVVETRLTEIEVDAIVRPVRSDLGPVSSAGRHLGVVAGEEVEARLAQTGALPVGGAVMTPAGTLPCAFLIHAVVMSDEEPQTTATMQRALTNALGRAVDWGLESLALPPIGIGVGMTEPEVHAQALVDILQAHVAAGQPPLDITIAVASAYEADLFRRLIQEGKGTETAT